MAGKLYFKKLDELRFIAFFLVFWQHGFTNSLSNIAESETMQIIISTLTFTGAIGVHVFFVISGFLITFLMIKEEKVNGRVNLKYFYIRRVLRIFPLYYLILILGIFILPALFNTFEFNGSVLKNLLFLNNFDMGSIVPNVNIAWSVAIEEQFYLVWPVVFIVFRNKKWLMAASFFLFMFSTIFTIQYPSLSYFHTFGNINYLMIGCMGAILYAKYQQRISKSSMMKSSGLYLAILISLLLIILPAFYPPIHFLSLIGLPLAYIYIVINLVDQGKSSRTSSFAKLGKYTYGMYLYHPMIIIFIKIAFDLLNLDYQNNAAIYFSQGIISLGATIAISIFSYEYFEKRILSFKNRFSFIKTRI